MSSSWGHAVARLDPDTVDEYDRWGRRCSTRRCAEPVTHLTSYQYVTGRAGRVSWAERRVCEGHAAQFARRYRVEIGLAPRRFEPRSVEGDLPAAHRAELQRIRGHPAGAWRLSLTGAGWGGLMSWAVSEFNLANGARLNEAIQAANLFLARRMFIAEAGWQPPASGPPPRSYR